MSREVLILQHVANENAGTILDFLKRENIPHRSVDLFKDGYRLPDVEDLRALIVMGGPMNVYEEDKFPFLIEENIFIQQAIEARVPYLGVCLGSQLLAKALQTKVYKAKKEEIGWDTVMLTPAAVKDKVFSAVKGEKLKVLQWHGDTFDLPRGAVHLAASEFVPHQAYQVGGLFYGLQFHVEVNRPMLENWFKDSADLPKILLDYDEYRKELTRLTDRMYANFFGLTKA